MIAGSQRRAKLVEVLTYASGAIVLVPSMSALAAALIAVIVAIL